MVLLWWWGVLLWWVCGSVSLWGGYGGKGGCGCFLFWVFGGDLWLLWLVVWVIMVIFFVVVSDGGGGG